MSALYNKSRNNMSIRVSRYDGNIYITNDPNESEEVNDDDDVSSVSKPVDTHHNQIKRYVFADTANVIPDIKKPWNEKIEFLGVFQSDLGKFDILYNGSIHAILSEEEFKEFDNMDEFNKCRFVLVKQMWKTSPHKFKKLFKYLYMAYLTKVNDIFVAYKDANGVVREPLEHKLLSHFSHFELKQLWSSEAFLLDFLCRIEKLMSDINCLDTVYVISNNGHNFYYKIYEGKTNKSFIPQFYQDHVKNKANI
ncbi:decapping and exoribonuclease protein Rai1-like isoform 2-T7 [Cochliomyia hominivorax]